MRIYISGPMSGQPDHGHPAFHAAAAELRAAGYKVANPAEEQPVVEGKEWHEYLRADLKLLVDCDAVALLPGWRASKGSVLEDQVARALGMRSWIIERWLEIGKRKEATADVQWVTEAYAHTLPAGIPNPVVTITRTKRNGRRVTADVILWDGRAGRLAVDDTPIRCFAWELLEGGSFYWDGTAWARTTRIDAKEATADA